MDKCHEISHNLKKFSPSQRVSAIYISVYYIHIIPSSIPTFLRMQLTDKQKVTFLQILYFIQCLLDFEEIFVCKSHQAEAFKGCHLPHPFIHNHVRFTITPPPYSSGKDTPPSGHTPDLDLDCPLSLSDRHFRPTKYLYLISYSTTAFIP